MKKAAFRPVLILLLGGFLFFSAAFIHQNGDLFFQIKKQLTIFSDVYKEVATQYVDEVSPEELMKRSINSMLESLDPYTVFIDEGEQQQMEILSSGTYGGIGIDAGFRGDQIVIIAPLDGYPAHRAGLRAGDVIEEINGVEVHGFSPEEVQQLTIGDVGTTVTLKIGRPGIEQSIEFELERERIEVKNISYAGLVGDRDQYGYIQLSRFGQQSAEEVRSELISMTENSDEFEGLVLDLRNNPGGLLNEAVELIDKFIEPGVTVVETRGRLDVHNNAFVTEEPAIFEDLPLVIIMNNGSASASEVVAGALQDLDRAVVIGESSFGKGLVQTVRPLSYNTSLKVTISKYFTPSGRSIQSIEYSGVRDRDGVAVADSLRRAFKTKNGRVVFDGRGIEPDITFDSETESLLQLSLKRNNQYFFFINDLLNQPDFDKDSFVEDSLFERFAKYLIEQGFTFETPADNHLNALQENIENFSQSSSAENSIDELKALLRDYKISQIYENQDDIEKNLRVEWISQTAGENDRNRSVLEIDEQVIRSLEILNDSSVYLSILRP